MKKAAVKSAKQHKAAPRVEILTADPNAFKRFVAALHRVNRGRSYQGMYGAQVSQRMGPYKTTPLSAGFVRQPEEWEPFSHWLRASIGPLNRPINLARVSEYKGEMSLGRWMFSPDAVVVTTEGHIINGQHRLLAADELIGDHIRAMQRYEKDLRERKDERRSPEKAARKAELNARVAAELARQGMAYNPDEETEEPEKPETPVWPQFCLIWNVDKKAALLMDEARRTANDRREIALRYAGATR